MRLFHVSEESDIEIFEPRMPKRQDLDQSTGLVWAITEECLPNFLTPRNCPRVAYHVGADTTLEDKRRYLSSETMIHVVAIENKWFEAMRKTTLYIYEFDPKDFYLQDAIAGYYVSEKKQTPIRKHAVEDLFTELFKRNVEIRVMDNLWFFSDKIQNTSFHWSMCRMGFAQERKEEWKK
jgi:hypothetical protein